MMPMKGDCWSIRSGQYAACEIAHFVLEQKAPPCMGAPQTEAASRGLLGVQGLSPATPFSATQKKISVLIFFKTNLKPVGRA